MKKEFKVLIEKAYAPYSKFQVACLIKTKDQQLIEGVNVENAAYSVCLCAERNALSTMVAQGYQACDIELIAVYAKTEQFISPCGVCRQAMAELLKLDCPVGLYNKNFQVQETTVEALLPASFQKTYFHND